jgi:hypothetical protein
MLVCDVYAWRSKTSLRARLLCQLGWDEKTNRINIIRGQSVGKNILKGKYLDKRCPDELRYIEASQGKDFIKNLCYGLCGSRIWASRAYEKENE